MPLVTTTEMFKKAYEGGYAIGAFNVNNMEIVQGITRAAKKLNAPVILQCSAGARKYASHGYLVAMVKAAAEETGLPIALHLDHGPDFETCKACIDGGFTSVMIDGSSLPYEENIAITQKVCEVAHLANVSVESELGTIGTTGNSIEGGTTGIIYTDPDQAKDFVEKTGIDTLAVAIGTAHGIYPSDMKPELRLDILQILKDTLDIPLVLHGGSSNKDEEIAKAVKIGISKINISSDIKVAFYDKCREVLNAHPEYREPLEIYPEPIKACREVIAHKVNLFDSADKVKYYYE